MSRDMCAMGAHFTVPKHAYPAALDASPQAVGKLFFEQT